jgi:hypothetical protein
MDQPELERAAAETKGRFYTVKTAGSVLDDLPPGRQVPVESLEPIVLWNKWPLVLAFTIFLVVEWVVRKRKGLL